ncbi:MAG: ATP-binding protein [Planctomycetota bacterium]
MAAPSKAQRDSHRPPQAARPAPGGGRACLFSVLDMLPGYTVLTDRRHAIRFANGGFLDAFGDPDGRCCYEVQFGRDRPCDDCPMAEVLGEGRRVDWEVVGPDGMTFHVWAFSVKALNGEDLMLEFSMDVTEQKRLAVLVSETSEAERRRIGRDLHDSLGQSMAGLSYLVGGLADRLAARLPAEREVAEQIVRTINEAAANLRSLAHGLDPVGIESEGLAAALTEIATTLAARHGTRCTFRCERPVAVDEAAAVQLYRIAQEATTNAVKHARCGRIEVTLAETAGAVELRITDDGIGLPSDLSPSAGMGLGIMRYRARAIGARLGFHVPPGGGTVVSCVLPKTSHDRRRGEKE